MGSGEWGVGIIYTYGFPFLIPYSPFPTPHSLSSNNSRYPALHTAIERAGAFRKDLDARPATGVFGLDLEERIILVVANGHERVEDRLFGHRVSVDRLKEIQLVIGILVRHILLLEVELRPVRNSRGSKHYLKKNAAHYLLENADSIPCPRAERQ